MYTQLNTERIEQEEYITLQGAQRVGLVKTDTVAVMEWTWERKTNVHHLPGEELVVLYRNVPRYRGQDIDVSAQNGTVLCIRQMKRVPTNTRIVIGG
ncbi:MAG: hypothetical protein NVS4B1_06800 [Ktedonobacteraceae bacterium]